jgi:hypothetical protein
MNDDVVGTLGTLSDAAGSSFNNGKEEEEEEEANADADSWCVCE